VAREEQAALACLTQRGEHVPEGGEASLDVVDDVLRELIRRLELEEIGVGFVARDQFIVRECAQAALGFFESLICCSPRLGSEYALSQGRPEDRWRRTPA
jgi:hypothetical protein